MKTLSWVAIGLATALVGFAAWVRGNPYDIGGAMGWAIGVLLIPFLIAYLIRGRKRKRNWDSFARWYFWLALLALALSSTRPK